MDQYFNITVKNHKKLNKKLIFVEYIQDDFRANQDLLKEMIKYYMQELEKHSEKTILIFDLRNIQTYDKKSVWEGAAELKKYDSFFIDHIERSFILIENKLSIQLLNIILKVLKNNVRTELKLNINEALKALEK